MSKLISSLVLLACFSLFIGKNITNKCEIWFFHTFENIPVWTALFTSFFAGVLVTIPFIFLKGSKDKKTDSVKDKAESIKQNKKGSADNKTEELK